MTTQNSYATLADFKNFTEDRSGVNSPKINLKDDSVIEHLLKSASRYIDTKTGRTFIPYVETRYFDVPGYDSLDSRLLELDDDLLEVISVVNGDGVTIPSTEYSLRPKNRSPYNGIRLIDNSTYYWASDGAGDTHDVIAVTGIWGYHDRYTQAWETGSTLAEALDASETGFDVASESAFSVGNIIRIDNELGYLSAVTTALLTSTRGENSSTAATHSTSTPVKIWRVMEEVKLACLEIANNAYHRRFGQSLRSEETITAAGIVLSPREIPQMAKEFINTYRRYL
jgi:hypothetical protein